MNLEIEQGVIGLLLTNNQLVAISELLPSHFAEPIHSDIFSEIIQGHSTGKLVTPVTLKDRYPHDYLASLIGAATTTTMLEHHSQSIRNEATKRKLHEAARGILESDASGAMAIIMNALDDANRSILGSQMRTAKQVSENIMKELAAEPPVYSTGLSRLDFAMNGGLHEGRLYGFPADSGHGKTLLASTISNNLKNAKVPHLYICAEMGENETHQRSIAKDLGIDSRAFYDKMCRGENFWSDLGYRAQTESECLIYYDDPFLTFDRLKQVISAAVVKYRIKGFILDYWQLVGGGERDRADFLGRVAQWQASACKRWKLWGINTAQLNRDGEVLGSGGLKRACDQMYNLIRPEMTEPYAYLEMTKSRYTKFIHVGSAQKPSLKINEKGGYFEQLSVHDYSS